MDESTLIYLCGHNVVFYQPEARLQRFLPGTPDCRITAFAVCPSRRLLALAERGERATVTIFDLTTLKRRKILTTPSGEGTKVVVGGWAGGGCVAAATLLQHWCLVRWVPQLPALFPVSSHINRSSPCCLHSLVTHAVILQEFVSLAFSGDGRFLAAQGSAPDWTLSLWVWEKSKVVASLRTATQPGHTAVQCLFQPGAQGWGSLPLGHGWGEQCLRDLATLPGVLAGLACCLSSNTCSSGNRKTMAFTSALNYPPQSACRGPFSIHLFHTPQAPTGPAANALPLQARTRSTSVSWGMASAACWLLRPAIRCVQCPMRCPAEMPRTTHAMPGRWTMMPRMCWWWARGAARCWCWQMGRCGRRCSWMRPVEAWTRWLRTARWGALLCRGRGAGGLAGMACMSATPRL